MKICAVHFERLKISRHRIGLKDGAVVEGAGAHDHAPQLPWPILGVFGLGIGQPQKIRAQFGTAAPVLQRRHRAHGPVFYCLVSSSATNSVTICVSLRLSFIAFFCSQR